MAEVYEICHQMVYHGNWRFQDIYALPVRMRRWFYERLVKQLTAEKEE